MLVLGKAISGGTIPLSCVLADSEVGINPLSGLLVSFSVMDVSVLDTCVCILWVLCLCLCLLCARRVGTVHLRVWLFFGLRFSSFYSNLMILIFHIRMYTSIHTLLQHRMYIQRIQIMDVLTPGSHGSTYGGMMMCIS